MKTTFKILILILALTCFSLTAFAQGKEKAPDFTLYNLSNSKVSLSDYNGKKPVLLLFWQVGCDICKAELRALKDSYPQLRKDEVELITINIAEPKNWVEKFLSKNSIDVPVLFDLDAEVAEAYGLLGVPTYFLIDKEMNIISMSHVLPEDYKELLSK